MKTQQEIIDELQKEVDIREGLLSQMVGTLYPLILIGEIYKIKKAIKVLEERL
jgi:hypothetical protein